MQHELHAVIEGKEAGQLRESDVVADDGCDGDPRETEDEQVVAADEVVLLHGRAELRDVQLVVEADRLAAGVDDDLGDVEAAGPAPRHSIDDRGLELPRQSAERVKGRTVQRFGQNGKPVEAGPRIVDARQFRQHHQIMTPPLELRPDPGRHAIQMPVPLDSGGHRRYVDLAGENTQCSHKGFLCRQGLSILP